MTSTQNVDVDELSWLRYLDRMIPEQCRAARAWLNWKQDDLASAASVGLSTIRDFESGKRVPIAATLGAMKAALEKKGAEFFVSEQTLGVHFKQAQKRA